MFPTHVERVLAHFEIKSQRQDGADAICPAHEDKRASLSISWPNGKVLLRCHAGTPCATDAVLTAAGLTWADLFEEKAHRAKPRIIATYPYCDEKGELLYEVVRFEPKDFRQRRPDGNGGWVWNMKDARRVLYRLPGIIEPAKAGGIVFVVEGEKDVVALEGLGLVATTNPGGAGKWRAEYAQALRGCKGVPVLPDNDPAGHQHAQDVARSLHSAGTKVKVVELPGLPAKGDVSDWIRAGGTKADLLALVKKAPRWEPTVSITVEEGTPEPNPLGFEDAESFLARVRNQPEPGWLIADLVPDEGICVWHGRPRSMKSLCAQDAALALATGTPAFGSQRFHVRESVGVLYLTEEDGERLWAFRLELMLAGRGLVRPPKLLRVLCRPGWNLERAEDQAAMLAAVRQSPDARVLFVDPARASMPSIDKGPGDGAAAVRFLRQLQRETAVRSIVVPHHDVKPARDQKDDRARAERASGGVIFSVADCPVSFERVDDRRCLAVPSHFKIGADPKAFRVTFQSETPSGEGFRGFVRASAETVDEATAEADADRERLLSYLRGQVRDGDPWGTTREIESGARLRHGVAGRVLEQLRAARLVEVAEGDAAVALGRNSRAKVWRLVPLSPAVPSCPGDNPQGGGGELSPCPHPPRRGGYGDNLPAPPGPRDGKSIVDALSAGTTSPASEGEDL